MVICTVPRNWERQRWNHDTLSRVYENFPVDFRVSNSNRSVDSFVFPESRRRIVFLLALLRDAIDMPTRHRRVIMHACQGG
jgi:hypothetical protein